jgi:hypothetical protein
MKKIIMISCLFFLSFSVFPQQIFKEEALVINVEVPVRVFKDGQFVDNLTIDDFQVFENGIPQKIDAVYLVKKRAIERSDERKRYVPETSRNFFLLFEISEYTPKLGEAIKYFIHNVILSGDNLFVITPLKMYKLRPEALTVAAAKEEMENQFKEILKKDALIANSEYRSTLKEIKNLARTLSKSFERGDVDPSRDRQEPEAAKLDSFGSEQFLALDLDEQLVLYASLLNKLEILRTVEQMKLLDFAKFLKYKEGQKHFFLFYQNEYIPQIEPRILNQYLGLYEGRPDISQIIAGLFDFYRRDISFDVDRVKKVYADSSVSIHFLIISAVPEADFGVRMEEHSDDIYNAYKQMAEASGGFIESSSNPAVSFQRAIQASENYYLLYYSPKNYTSDEKFKEIQVKVKDESLKIIHRLGYFAN